MRLTGERILPETSLSRSRQYYVFIHRLRPPVSPQLGTKASGTPDANLPSTKIQTRVMHKGASASADEMTPSQSPEAIRLRSSKDLPDHHFFYLELDGVEDWDLAWFAVPSS